jgi:uncharacterized protein (DUF362 family)
MGKTRRRFIKELGALSVGLPLSASLLSSVLRAGEAKPPGQSRVVIARDSGVLRDGEPVPQRVSVLLETGLRELLDPRPAEPLKAILGGSSRIGIKINCLGGRPLATRREVAYGLADLIVSKIESARVTIWDRSEHEMASAGFQIKRDGNIECLATDSEGMGYESSLRESGAVGSKFSRVLTEHCDSVISLAVLKDHGIAGISGCMKNFYGVIHNPNKYHPNGCDPYVADLYQAPVIRERHRLSVVDGLVGAYNGGPGYKSKYRWEFKGLVIGLDAVAVDRVCLDLIEKKRREAGIPSLAEQGRRPEYVFTAGRRGVGCSDLEKIEIVEIQD